MSIYYQDDLVTLHHGKFEDHIGDLRGNLIVAEPPYIVRAYRYTDGDLDQGRAQWHEALREYAARDAANDWTVPAEIELIALPAWYAPLEDLEF